LYEIFFFIMGTIIGSYLNVVILRTLAGESLIYPPSHCPKCSHRLAPWDLVPVLSYILLRGRCRYCGAAISIQYPLIEFITGIVFVLLYLKYGLTFKMGELLVLASISIVVFVTDIREMTVSHAVTAAGFIIVLILKIIAKENLLVALQPAAVLFFIFSILYTLGYIGDGDVTLAAFIGFTVGPILSVAAIFWMAIIGGIYGSYLVMQDKKNLKREVPLAPFLVAGCTVAVLLEPQIKSYFDYILSFI